LQVSRIVIDAGHGGRDPGAHANGLRESEVVLDIARRVAERLAAEPGVEVVMTRNDDTFVPLGARTALANEVDADLFLSIHANASRNTRAHGVETYYLDFALNEEAEQIAARENLAAGGKMKDLQSLLETIAANSKLQESREFAGVIQRAMVSELRAAHGEVRDLGVKQAPFFVLIGAHMPSVLAEVSFLTNRREADLLATDAYRERIADALIEGVLHYRKVLDPAPRVTQQD
jgi:N-acetylmuramoyl-L-alanine amidase